MKTVIDSFRDEYRFLSNFWPCQIISIDGIVYPSVEHAYQAAKTVSFEEKKPIQYAYTAGIAKNLGQKVTKRSDWEEIKQSVMLELVRKKFKSPILAKLLLHTGNAELIEGNYWGDTYWGICNNVGQNNLGKILMQVRSEIK